MQLKNNKLENIKSTIFLIVLSIILTNCNGQEIPDTVNNEITSEHVNVYNTRVYLKIPDDFRLVPYTNNVIINDNTFLQINVTPGKNFIDITKKNLTENKPYMFQGYKWKEWKEFKINGYDAFLTIMEADNYKYNLSFIFGDNDFEVYINSLYPREMEEEERKIINMLLSICYEKDAIIDYEKNKFFEIDFLDTDYKFSKVAYNQYIYTERGIGNPEDINTQNKIFVMNLPFIKSESQIIEHSKRMIDIYKSSDGFKDFTVLKEEEFKINDMYAYAVTASFTTVSYDENGEYVFYDGVLYQVVTGNEDMGLIYGGQTYNDVEKELKTFENIAQTLKFKKSN